MPGPLTKGSVDIGRGFIPIAAWAITARAFDSFVAVDITDCARTRSDAAFLSGMREKRAASVSSSTSTSMTYCARFSHRLRARNAMTVSISVAPLVSHAASRRSRSRFESSAGTSIELPSGFFSAACMASMIAVARRTETSSTIAFGARNGPNAMRGLPFVSTAVAPLRQSAGREEASRSAGSRVAMIRAYGVSVPCAKRTTSRWRYFVSAGNTFVHVTGCTAGSAMRTYAVGE